MSAVLAVVLMALKIIGMILLALLLLLLLALLLPVNLPLAGLFTPVVDGLLVACPFSACFCSITGIPPPPQAMTT